jgi:type II secretory pathway component PulK
LAKKVKLRYGRIAAALCVLAVIVALIYAAIQGIIWGFNYLFRSEEGNNEKSQTPQMVITP